MPRDSLGEWRGGVAGLWARAPLHAPCAQWGASPRDPGGHAAVLGPAGGLTRWGCIPPCRNSPAMPGEAVIRPQLLAETPAGYHSLRALAGSTCRVPREGHQPALVRGGLSNSTTYLVILSGPF